MTDADPEQPSASSEKRATPNPGAAHEPLEVEATPFDPGGGREKTFDVPPPVPPSGDGGDAGPTPPAGSPLNMAWPMACHLTTLIDFGLTPLIFGFLPALMIWLWKKDEDPEVAYHGRESLNFQLNLLFWWLVSLPLSFCCIGVLGVIALPVIKIVFVVIATLRTAEGQRYRYPCIYRVIE